MTYKVFIETIKKEMTERLGEQKRVIVSPILKNNGTVYDGLIIHDPVCNISPTIYLNPFYERYLDGMEFEKIVEDIMEMYWENKPKKDFNVSKFMNFENARNKLIMKLVNTEQNERLLEDIPHRAFHDLSIVYIVIMEDFKNELATVLVHKQHMEMWGVEEQDLYEAAMENTPNLMPYRLENMDRILKGADIDTIIGCLSFEMYVLTNRMKIFGATCIAYPRMLKRIADLLEDNLIIIPSSVHEVIIIPENEAGERYPVEELNEMINEVNDAELSEVETLNNHVYYFNRESEALIF